MQQQFDKKTYHSGNMYQIFTYVKNKAYEDNTKEVSGMLLYAKTDEEISPYIETNYKKNILLVIRPIKIFSLNFNFFHIALFIVFIMLYFTFLVLI